MAFLGIFTEQAELSTQQLGDGDLHRLPPHLYTDGLVLEIYNYTKTKLMLTGAQRAGMFYAVAPNDQLIRTIIPDYLDGTIQRLKSKLTKLRLTKSNPRYLIEYGGVFKLIEGTLRNNQNAEPISMETAEVAVVANSTNNEPDVVDNRNQNTACKTATCEATKEHNTLLSKIKNKRKILADLDRRIIDKRHEFGHYSVKNVKRRKKRTTELLKKFKDSNCELNSQNSKLQQNEQTKDQLNGTIEEMKAVITDLQKRITEIEIKNEDLVAEMKRERVDKAKITRKMRTYRDKLESNKDCVPKTKFHMIRKELTEAKESLKYWQLEADKQRDGVKVVDLMEDKSYNIETRMLVTELTGLEIAQSKISPVIEAVGRNLFGVSFPRLPDAKTVRNMNNEAHFIGKKFIADKLLQAKNITIDTDGTSRKRKNLLDTTVYCNPGGAICLSFEQVANETSETIADTVINQLTELKIVNKSENYLLDVVEKISAYMSDLAANEKKKDRLLDNWIAKTLSDDNTDTRVKQKVHHFFCMAHVLLGFHKNVSDVISALQKELEKAEGKFGRDKMPWPKWSGANSIVERVPRRTRLG